MKQVLYPLIQIKLQKLKEKDKKNALNEIRFLASIENPYVVEYKEAFYDEKTETLCIVMEYADDGDLQVNLSTNLVPHQKISADQDKNPRGSHLEGSLLVIGRVE